MLFRIEGKPLGAKSGMVKKLKGLLVVFVFAFAELWTNPLKLFLQMPRVAEMRICVYS